MIPAARRAILPASIAAISATAWVVVWRLGESPWGRWAHSHGSMAHGPMDGPAPISLFGAAFLAGWVTMTIAMMLPTTLPLLQIFRRLTAGRPDGVLLLLLVIGGYLATWAACGIVVLAASSFVQGYGSHLAWLTSHPRMPSAALFVIAGTFQFSDLKYRCLDKCRSPLSFITSRWRGTREKWQSFRLGVEHGAFCVGCCWALMLLMFASSVASLTWMLALGAVMAVEKNVSWGRRLSRPVGVALLVAAPVIALLPR
jgi:predicted metal-binding membrane protein